MSPVEEMISYLTRWRDKCQAAIAALEDMRRAPNAAVRMEEPPRPSGKARPKVQPKPAKASRVETVNGRRRFPSRQRFSDGELLEAIRAAGGMAAMEAATKFRVSEPAMRQRLRALVDDGALTKGTDKKFQRTVGSSVQVN